MPVRFPNPIIEIGQRFEFCNCQTTVLLFYWTSYHSLLNNFFIQEGDRRKTVPFLPSWGLFVRTGINHAVSSAGLQAATPANAPGKAEGRAGRDTGGTPARRITGGAGGRTGAAGSPGPAWPGRTAPVRSSWCSSSFPWPYRYPGYGCWRRTGSQPQRPGC